MTTHICIDDVSRIIEENRNFVLRICRSRLPHDQDAQDATQETMLRFLTADRSKIHSPTSWLVEVAIRVCSRWHRRRYQHPELLVDDITSHGVAGHDASVLASERIWMSDLANQLGARDYRILHMLYVQHLSSIQVGEALGLTPGNVRVLSHRARRAAARLLTQTSSDTALV